MTSYVPSPNKSQVMTALRQFLVGVLPAGVVVVQGQANRVAEPGVPDFVVMTPTNQRRIETNVDGYVDAAFTASITGSVMTVTSIQLGVVPINSQVFGSGLAAGSTTITGFLSGTGVGGIGTYSVSQSQNAPSQTMAAGAKTFLQPSEYTIQLDVHGPNSMDNTQTITTLFRDEFGVALFAASGYDVAPLYADDPKQVPFINDQSQYEDRWIIEAHIQANQVVSAAQQFASALSVTLIEVP